MSSEKEFDAKSTVYTKSFGYLLNLEERGLAQDAFSTAWDFQQTKLDAKDKEIERLKKENEKLKLYNIAMKACIVGLDKQILRVEDADDNQTQQKEIRRLCEFLNNERQTLKELGEVESEL